VQKKRFNGYQFFRAAPNGGVWAACAAFWGPRAGAGGAPMAPQLACAFFRGGAFEIANGNNFPLWEEFSPFRPGPCGAQFPCFPGPPGPGGKFFEKKITGIGFLWKSRLAPRKFVAGWFFSLSLSAK